MSDIDWTEFDWIAVKDMDLSNSEKNGILYMEDAIERDWVPHFFVLTKAKMFYTEVQPEDNEPEEAEEESESETAQQRLREVTSYSITDLHFITFK